MSDIKRIALSTLEPQKVSEKQSKKSVKTIRISVILPESNEDKCPEYNYKDELAAVKKRSKLSKEKKDFNNVPNGLDPFGDDDDDDVRRIAMQMEEKYGTIVSGNKKKRKGRKDDYADIGMGYDESDSFIDNTDGYDEIIPQNVTTLHGGFYINSGALEFKTDDEATSDFSSSSSDSENETDNNKSINRKRILETSEEEDVEENGEKLTQEQKKQKMSNKNSMQQAIKKKLFSQNKIQVKKRRPIDPIKKTMNKLLREKREDLNLSIPVDLKTDNDTTVVEDSEKESHKENKKPMSLSSVDDAIESVVKANLAEKTEFDNNGNNRTLEHNSSIIKPVVDVSLAIDGESSHDTKTENIDVVKLPENLPADILEIINSIKRAALECKDEKIKFFREEVNLQLLSLERKCRCLGKSSRAKVYEHLAPFAKCKKETLIRRAKNLVFEDEQKKLKKMLVKLKAGIDEIMPPLLANHEKESQKILQKKFSQESVTNEETKSLRMPHRKFQWSEELRKLFKDITATKRRCFLFEGKPKDTLDELIMQYLKTDIQNLWPDGWMSLAALRKACNIDMTIKKPEKPIENVTSMTKVQDINKNTSLSTTIDSKNHSVNNEIHKHSQKNSTLSLNNSNLQIIPVTSNNVTKPPTFSSKNEITSDITVSKISSNSNMKPSQKLPDKKLIISSSFNKEEEPIEKEDHKFYDFSKTIQLTDTSIQQIDSSVIVSTPKPRADIHHKVLSEEKKDINAVIIEPKHCHVIDLTDNPKKKPGPKSKTMKPIDFTKPIDTKPIILNDYLPKPTDFSTKPVKETDYSLKANDVLPIPMDFSKEPIKLKNKHTDLSIVPNYHPAMEGTSEVDDIQKVMENLKTLQKLSSPSKSADSSMSSPVSVIAFNKSFSPKTQSINHARNDYNTTGFQDEFQKQLVMSSLTQMSTPTSSKSNYNRCS